MLNACAMLTTRLQLIYCMSTANRYDGTRTFDRNLPIGLVKDLILQLTVSNKANDYAYYSKMSVKCPRSLGYQGTSEVSNHIEYFNVKETRRLFFLYPKVLVPKETVWLFRRTSETLGYLLTRSWLR